VVVTPVGALPEILEDGVNGFFVNIGDVDDIAKKVERLIIDEELRRKIGLHNREYAFRKFDVKNMAKNLVDIWIGAFENRTYS